MCRCPYELSCIWRGHGTSGIHPIQVSLHHNCSGATSSLKSPSIPLHNLYSTEEHCFNLRNYSASSASYVYITFIRKVSELGFSHTWTHNGLSAFFCKKIVNWKTYMAFPNSYGNKILNYPVTKTRMCYIRSIWIFTIRQLQRQLKIKLFFPINRKFLYFELLSRRNIE